MHSRRGLVRRSCREEGSYGWDRRERPSPRLGTTDARAARGRGLAGDSDGSAADLRGCETRGATARVKPIGTLRQERADNVLRGKMNQLSSLLDGICYLYKGKDTIGKGVCSEEVPVRQEPTRQFTTACG